VYRSINLGVPIWKGDDAFAVSDPFGRDQVAISPIGAGNQPGKKEKLDEERESLFRFPLRSRPSVLESKQTPDQRPQVVEQPSSASP
jgi:hypothetical protein